MDEEHRRVVEEVMGRRRSPTLWLAEHRIVSCSILVVVAGTLGYFGQLGGRFGTQPVRSGVPGLLYGVAGTLLALAAVGIWWRFRRRR